MRDARVGLSIDSDSACEASDLSESEGSYPCFGEASDALLDIPQSVSLDTLERSAGGCTSSSRSSLALHQNHEDHQATCGVRGLASPGRSPSFRSRIHRRLTEDSIRNERIAPAEDHDDNPIRRPGRAPSLRFFLTLFSLTLVLLSTVRNTSREGNIGRSSFMSDVRREEVILPLHASADFSHPSGTAVRNQLRTGNLPKYSLAPSEMDVTVKQSLDLASLEAHLGESQISRRSRLHMAMARNGPQRPTFGVSNEQVERFVLDNAPPPKLSEGLGQQPSATNWTSWIACLALVAMLVETGYKEYYQCITDQSLEEQRRL